MHQYVQIFMWDEPMGIIAWNAETQQVQFEFLPSFIRLGYEMSPILFPIEKLRQKPKVFSLGISGENAFPIPPFFTDCIPGKYAKDLLSYALHDSEKTPESLSPLAYLSLLGNRGMGAYRFEPSGYPELNQSEAIDIDLLVRYAHSLYQTRGVKMTERRIRELLRSGLFTRGSWPKSLVAINDFTGEVISGQTAIPDGFEGWILKMDGVKNLQSETLQLEYNYYKKAIECGIVMAPYRLLKDGNKTHLLCKRFDRHLKEKVHIQSFAALRDEKADSYEAAFRCMRQLRLPYPDIEQLFKRLVFNVLVGNCNDHAEKILFSYAHGGEWRLAPAFNLKPTPDKKDHTLSVCGKVRNIRMEDLLILGKLQNIKKAKIILNAFTAILGQQEDI